MDVLFFETCLLFLFFFPHYITIGYHPKKWFLFLGPLPYAGERPTPKAITLLFKKKLVVERRRDEILFKHSTYNSNFFKNILNFSSQIPLWFSPLNIIKWFIVHYPLWRTPHESSTHLSKCQCCFPASKGGAPALHIMYFFSSLHLLMPTIAPSPLHWLKLFSSRLEIWTNFITYLALAWLCYSD